MPRSRTILSLLAIAMAIPTTCAIAQASPAPAGCTYQACALRVEPEFWGPRLVRGASGEHVGDRLGGFGKGAEVLLESPSDSARAFGRSYVANSKRSGWLGLGALAAYLVVAHRTDSFRHGDQLGTEGTVAAVGGVLFAIPAAVFARRAQADLSRGVWWYNAALPTR